MAEFFAQENRGRTGDLFSKFREGIIGVFVGIAGERKQRFDLRGDIGPGAQFAAAAFAPRFRGEGALHGVEHGQLEKAA